jgi:ABC-2 type transport system ATP-binding protein
MILQVQGVSKSFAKVQAVRDLSLRIDKGRIVGLLGPNGAGKTTLIRLVMDIYKPDAGTIELATELSGKNRKNHIGYLPEERGLYGKDRVMDQITYFARLKGLSAAQAKEQGQYFLSRLAMTEVAKWPLNKLSKGNQQKIQLICTLVSLPELVILDEPFSGLDPINTRLVIELLLELRQRGISIVLSTHQMDRAEDLCDELLLVDRGRLLLSGQTQEIIRRFSSDEWLVDARQLPPHACYQVLAQEELEENHFRTRLNLNKGFTSSDLLAALAETRLPVLSVAPHRKSLSDIFIEVVEASHVQN